MSVLIKGAKLPKSCFGCHLFKLDDQDLWCIANHYAGCCRVLSKYIDENKFVTERHPDCPLIEIPPHGRLVDLDQMIDRFWDGNSMEVFKSELEQIQTVIEAEE